VSTGQNPFSWTFGRHVRSLRRARGQTQEDLATRSTLSPDTIRRLESGSFSPSLDTLRKLCRGLDLRLSTLFESHELCDRNHLREFVDLVATRSPDEIMHVYKIAQLIFDKLDDDRPGPPTQ
jgi:transcriptional regulator with XRE-family HTH domain